VRWAKSASGPTRGRTPSKVSQVLETGDIVYVEPIANKEGQYRLRQIPEISGAMVAMDPQTGRVLAMVGGFSYDQSQFNRATQALRQPGSSFKPIVYATALDNGYTPSSVVLDAPLEIDTGSGVWRPENYEGKFYGPSTLRFGIERSRNVMTVRLAQDIGMPLIGEYAKRLGVYDNLPPYLSFALGAGETTLLRMVGAYAMFDNGGRKIQPTLIDRVQDRYGHTVYKHDQRECRGCTATKWENQAEPSLIDKRERVLDPMTAYQITSMMEGVVQRGTGTAVKEVGKPIAGKTGTTNDEKDVWFVGFAPDLVVGVFMGYDKPRHIGDRATGGGLAAPIFRDFMKVALADKPGVPFRVPAGIKLIRVDPKSGMRASPGESRVILEAFKPGTAPPDNNSVVGVTDSDGRPLGVSPEADRMIRSGTGGLY
jgi:penicillin-binding protein 1A